MLLINIGVNTQIKARANVKMEISTLGCENINSDQWNYNETGRNGQPSSILYAHSVLTSDRSLDEVVSCVY